MCGIVAYVGPRDAAPLLLEGLARLEYRGYDSAGLAVVGNGGLRVHKDAGRVRALAASVPSRFPGRTGVAHTRWATHGVPSKANAHPHTDATGRYAIVHNGIVENSAELRAKLEAEGVCFASETDSEVLAHLIARADAPSLAEAVRLALSQVTGAYGLAVVDREAPGQVVVAANGSPVVLGLGDREMFAASDPAALVRHTRQVVHLDDGELAVLEARGYRTFTLDARETSKRPSALEGLSTEAYELGGYTHFMQREIHDQPETVARTLSGRLDDRFSTAHLGGLELDARQIRSFRRVRILGCGSAYYAGELGARLVEELARIPADAESASEWRYRNPVIDPDTLYVAVSQSGETADTLRAVQELRRRGAFVLGVVNAVGSSIARECDGGIYLHAGPEVSVTSTKTFTSTAVVFALLGLYLGRIRDLSPADGARLVDGLRALPGQITTVLGGEDLIDAAATQLAAAASSFYVGRGRGWPVAREGAQKLKEVSYRHAEAYPASELKHGPLALVGPELPTVAVVPDDELFEKNCSTLAEIRARSGPVLAVAHRRLPAELAETSILVPKNEPELDPILLGIPLQLLAYHAALALGTDVDRPRNLAKSVTVE